MSSYNISFASENYAGVHPSVMQALINANHGYERSYGKDSYTEKATMRFKEHFGEQVEVLYTYNGTGANVFAASTMLNRFEAMMCADVAHVYEAESTAFEALTGCRLIPVPSENGKITPNSMLSYLKRQGDMQHPQIKAFTITQPTEFGTVYSLDELDNLSAFAREHNLLFHIDGARLFNAAVALDCDLKESTRGADVITVGGTKSGMMFGEAVVFIHPDVIPHKIFLLKRSMQIASKARFISCQFEAMLSDYLWKQIATRTNELAKKLQQAISSIPGVIITRPVETNAVFAIIPSTLLEATQNSVPFYVWNDATNESRFICSFDTSENDIDFLINAMQQ